MVNHSLFKLILFLCAGVVTMNAHAVDLDGARGFGRRKPLLHLVFLSGMLGIAGAPYFSGYVSNRFCTRA
jgi:hydrogenase-4 component B